MDVEEESVSGPKWTAKAKYPYYFYSKKAFRAMARYGAARGEAVRQNYDRKLGRLNGATLDGS